MQLLKKLDINNCLFIDIETVAGEKQLTEKSPMWASWDYKMRHGREPIGDGDPATLFNDKAALFAEFGKIVCITIGKVVKDEIVLKSFYSDSGLSLLQDFSKAVQKIVARNRDTVLVGWAIKGFDMPYVMRRMIANQVELPLLFDTAGEKPWTVTAIDLMELWKGTAFTGGSLISVATTLGLTNPKDDIEGCQTTDTYYNEKDGLERIKTYCEKDVLTTANVFLKCRYDNIVTAKVDDSGITDQRPVGVMEEIHNTKKVSVKAKKHVASVMETLDGKEQLIAKELLNIVSA